MSGPQMQTEIDGPLPGAPAWRCTRYAAADVIRLAIGGELDLATAPALDRALRRAQAEVGLVLLDLRQLEFIDSTGGRVILAAQRRARDAGDRFAVVRAPTEVYLFLELAGFVHSLRLVDHPAEVAGAGLLRVSSA